MTTAAPAPRPGAASDRATWVLGAALVLYVAVCTGQRDHAIFADAWEHHRVVKALVADLTSPGNPTYALDTPSIRYSPYTVALAAVCRATGLDPWHALSAAAVVSTTLLVAGIRLFLGALGRPEAAPAALLVATSLYGVAPAYASSNALADLPWNQVNPSAPALALTLLLWTAHLRLAPRAPAALAALVPGVLLAVVLLDHAMTGALAGLGLAAVAVLAVPPDSRRRALLVACASVATAAAICLAWPWYDFAAAVALRPDPDYWFNPNVLRRLFTMWAPPALLLSLACLTGPDRRTARVLLAGAWTAALVGLAAALVRSPTLARIPIPGLLFAHLAVAVFVSESGILQPATWGARLRAVRTPSSPGFRRAALETVTAAAIVAGLAPQLVTIARKPWLAREFVAPLVGAAPAGPSVRDDLSVLLASVGERDVVLSDVLTSWAVPSVRGRIVAAHHYEFFVPGQKERTAEVHRFFGDATEAERRATLARHAVRWIVVDETRTKPSARETVVRDGAVAARHGRFVLLDATRW